MAGTLFLLRSAGWESHYMNIADGCCGSMDHGRAETAATRLKEAQSAAGHLGAHFYPPLVPDLEIFYEKPLLARVASIMRAVAPDVLLVPSPQDYMEDHVNTSRLAVTAAFCRGMINFPVEPYRPTFTNDVVIYHAQPHGNRDILDRLVTPDFMIDIESVLDEKRDMLAAHASQKVWLDKSQGMDAYLEIMRSFAREVAGHAEQPCAFAEGWRRHNPLGFCSPDARPLEKALAKWLKQPASPTQ
jgi:LmbE family N-acetylglucosaminyl deacetylase